jgi:hypothetical protein
MALSPCMSQSKTENAGSREQGGSDDASDNGGGSLPGRGRGQGHQLPTRFRSAPPAESSTGGSPAEGEPEIVDTEARETAGQSQLSHFGANISDLRKAMPAAFAEFDPEMKLHMLELEGTFENLSFAVP